MHTALVVVYSLLLVSAFVALKFVFRDRAIARAQPLQGRPELSEHELWHIYYATSGISEQEFAAAWTWICATAKLSPRRLRPDDRIKDFVNGNPRWIVGDEWNDVLIILMCRAKKAGISIGWEHIDTVDTIVRLAVESARHSTKGFGNTQ